MTHEAHAAAVEAADPDAIHRFFGLSYANYLVLPRSMLQEMPPWWQERFVALLEWAGEQQIETPSRYTVLMRGRDGRIKKDPWADYSRGRHGTAQHLMPEAFQG